MDEFSKTKTAFAAGFLAVLLAGEPALRRFFPLPISVIGLTIHLEQIFWATTAMIALSVYLTGVRLVSVAPRPGIEKFSNLCYGIAVLLPPAAIVGYVVSEFASRVFVGPVGTFIAGAIVGVTVGGSLIVGLIRVTKVLEFASVNARVEMYEKIEATQFTRAEELFKQGHFDLAVIDAFRSLEAALRRKLVSEGIASGTSPSASLVATAVRTGLLPESQLKELQEIQRIRNRAAHSATSVSADEAERVLKGTSALLAKIVSESTTRQGRSQAKTRVNCP